MPHVEIRNGNLVVLLTRKEKLASLRKEISIPISDIESVTIYEGFPRGIGLRCPGTGFPGVIYAGTFYKNRAKQFVYWRRKETPVAIKVRNSEWSRIIIGSNDSAKLMNYINEARR